MTTETINELKQFQLFVPPTSKSYTENDDGTITIEGIASTTNKDLQGDIILPSAIHSMKKQLLTTTKNLHGDHWYGLDGIYGAIKNVLNSDENSLKIRAIIRKSKAAEIKEMLDVGVQLGLSIGGKITKYTINEDGWEIKDLLLMEISLTGMPANWDTYGTIQESTEKNIVKANCLAGACHVIRKNIKKTGQGDNMPHIKTKETNPSDVFTKDDAVDLFNELMASKQDEIVREIASETVKQVSKEIPSLVKSEFEKLKDTSSNPTEEDDDESEEETDDKEKTLTELINKTVKSAVEENISNLFKDLEKHREPKFKVDTVKEKDLDNESNNDDDVDAKGMTSQEIAEKMFQNQSQDNMIRSLLG